MSKAIDKAVSRSEDQTTWDFACPGVQGSPCGDLGVAFTSTGWPTKATAAARGQQHFDEHKLGAAIAEARSKAKAAAGENEQPAEVDVAAIIKKTGLKPMSTLDDFRAEHNLGVTDDGAAVSLEDI